VQLKGLAVYYYRPALPAALKGREHFGLPASGTLYACLQTLFKFHPAFDEILAGILRRDPRSTLALLQGRQRHWEEMLKQRFAATMPDVADRIVFVPQQDHAGFMNLTALADVLLDPIHFGGGNTSYEGLALGTPIVTLPSPFLRGRITLALYRQLGMLDCVVSNPAEYIELATKLGKDEDYRKTIRAKILDANDVLFENDAGVRELMQFLRDAVAKRALQR
jgi:predicted O-linked N-acetylglucosamine transferase (SPINDLY family)